VQWVDAPNVDRAFRTRDPQGIPLEFYARMDRLPPIHQKYALYSGVKALRIDHFNCFSPDVDQAVAFWNEIGFRVTEYTEDAEAAGFGRRGRTARAVCMTSPLPTALGPRLHHTAFWVPTPLNIIDLLDLMSTTGWLPISSAGRDGTAFPTPSSSMSATRTGTGSRSIADYQTVDPGSGADQVGPEGPAAPDALGRAGAAVVVRRGQPVRRHSGHRQRSESQPDHRAMKRLATFTAGGRQLWGAVGETGLIALSDLFRNGTPCAG
jgi:catechol 2,3-dioxygenase-like lactoylglutathione lyase family enzyme